MKITEALELKFQYKRGDQLHYVVESNHHVFGATLNEKYKDDARSVVQEMIERWEHGDSPTGLDILE